MKRADPRQFSMFTAIDAPVAHPGQLDMRDLLAKPAPIDRKPYAFTPQERAQFGDEHAIARREAFEALAPDAVSWDEHGRPRVQTRAYGGGTAGVMTIYNPEGARPIELTVRGIPFVWANGGTYAIEGHGSPFWSETGFRSFCGATFGDAAAIVAMVERFIDAPAKDGNGCGGRLTRWWPSYALMWRQSLAFELECARDRSTMWNQWGPEKHAEHWANHDRKLADSLERMRADGIDPNDIGPPAYFKGKWPCFDQAALL